MIGTGIASLTISTPLGHHTITVDRFGTGLMGFTRRYGIVVAAQYHAEPRDAARWFAWQVLTLLAAGRSRRIR